MINSSLDSPGNVYWYGCLGFAFDAYGKGGGRTSEALGQLLR